MSGRRRTGAVLVGLLLGLAAVGATAEGPPDEARALVARARALLGGDEALAAVHSLRYDGRIEVFATGSEGRVRLYLRKPSFQRLEVELDGLHQITAVNGVEGWEILIDRRGETPRRAMRPLSAREFARNHVMALENLWFHHGYLHGDGDLHWAGASVFEGRIVGTVEVRYGSGLELTRRFDERTGALAASIGVDGTEARERSHVILEGVRLPRVTDYFRGGERRSRITFEHIEINPELDPALFRYPVE